MSSRLSEIIDLLRAAGADHHVGWLRAKLPQHARQMRLDQRDQLLRRIASEYYGDMPSARSQSATIAADVARLSAVAQVNSQDCAKPSLRGALLKFLQLNEGRVLGARQIRTILSSDYRTPLGKTYP